MDTKDTNGNPVTDPLYTVTDNFGNQIATDSSIFKLYSDRTYTITVSAENYTAEDGSPQAVIENYTPSKDESLFFTLKDMSVNLADGTYTIGTTSDSSMFAFYNTKVIVKNKKAWLIVTLKGTGFDRLYLGDCSAADARPAEEDTICYAPEVINGSEHFTFWPVPVVSLEEPLSISGHSAKKDLRYHHIITFNESSSA